VVVLAQLNFLDDFPKNNPAKNAKDEGITTKECK
jgi:hypothetical protein